MTQERLMFDKQLIRKDFLLYKGIAYESEVSDLLCSMMKDFPPNIIAFDHQVVASGQRFLVSIIVQIKSQK